MVNIILGTKAQLIKMAPVMLELKKRKVEYFFIHTGQHQETIEDILANFEIKEPDLIMWKDKDVISLRDLALWTPKIVLKFIEKEKSLNRIMKGVTLVHGDTFSTLIGAIAGKMYKKRVAHVEAGLRSFDIFNPFPEEITRLLVSRLSDIYFAPGPWALYNLRKYKGEKYDTKMNTLFDSLRTCVKKFDEIDVDIPSGEYAVVSIHRAENINSKRQLRLIISLLNEISTTIPLIIVAHLPTFHALNRFALLDELEKNDRIEVRSRYDYFRFVKLIYHSEFMITDGGSNQEECYYLSKPCLLFRYRTERREGLEENVCLSEFDRRKIKYFLDDYSQFKSKIDIRQEVYPSRYIVDNLINMERG